MVRTPGLEPGRLEARDFKSLVSTNSTMPALFIVLSNRGTRTRIRTEISQLSVATEYKPAVLPLNYPGDVFDFFPFELSYYLFNILPNGTVVN